MSRVVACRFTAPVISAIIETLTLLRGPAAWKKCFVYWLKSKQMYFDVEESHCWDVVKVSPDIETAGPQVEK
jgi:hypothetical protein